MRAWAAALGALPGVLVAVWASAQNPWFLDDPFTYAALACAIPAAVVALLVRRGGASRRSFLVPLGIEALVLAACSLLPHTQPPAGTRLLIFGIDGATWTVADRLDLPHLRALAARGARAVLRSREPMFSPLLWTTLATGRTPEEHGVRGFRMDASHCRAGRFWDVAAASAMKVGIYKWLETYPPEETNGFVVPAWLAPEPDTWPPELRFVKEIELSRRESRARVEGRPLWRLAMEGVPEGIRWSTLRDGAWVAIRGRLGGEPDPVAGQLVRVRLDRDVFVRQLARHRPDLATFTVYATDALGHLAWGDWERGGPRADAVPAAYRVADEVLGELVDVAGPGAAVLVLSDHGFRSATPADAARSWVPLTSRLEERLAAEVGPVEVVRLGRKLVVTPADGVDVARLVVGLDRLVRASTGGQLYRWEPLPDGHAIGLTLSDERVEPASLASDTVAGDPLGAYVRAGEPPQGEHDLSGLFVAAGPGVMLGDLGTVELLDVAPTALSLLGLPAARDMPGRALFGEREARVESYDDLAPARRLTRTAAPAVDEERLKALGYVE